MHYHSRSTDNRRHALSRDNIKRSSSRRVFRETGTIKMGTVNGSSSVTSETALLMGYKIVLVVRVRVRDSVSLGINGAGRVSRGCSQPWPREKEIYQPRERPFHRLDFLRLCSWNGGTERCIPTHACAPHKIYSEAREAAPLGIRAYTRADHAEFHRRKRRRCSRSYNWEAKGPKFKAEKYSYTGSSILTLKLPSSSPLHSIYFQCCRVLLRFIFRKTD